MSTEAKQAGRWKTLIDALPAILSVKRQKANVKSNFEGIDKACKDLGQTPLTIFRRLKFISSLIVSKTKSAKVQNNGDESSSDSDDDQPLKFTKKAVIPKTTQPVEDRKCTNCGGKICSSSKGLCRDCHDNRGNKKDRKCASCGGPISSISKGLCRTCHNNRGSKNNRKCASCGGPISSISKGLCQNCINNRGKPTSRRQIRLRKRKKIQLYTCFECLEDREAVKDGLCRGCYGKEDGNQDRETIEQDSNDGEETSANNVPILKQTLAKTVKKSIAPASTTKRDRKTSKCLDCQAPIFPSSKRCKECYKISLKVKPADIEVKKKKVEDDSGKSGKVKISLKRSTIDAGLKSNESLKKRRMTDD